MTLRERLYDALKSGPSYGLELAERLGVSAHRVYPPLRDMEDEGLLESYEGPPLASRGGYPRRYYKIAGGRRVLEPEQSAPDLSGLVFV